MYITHNTAFYVILIMISCFIARRGVQCFGTSTPFILQRSSRFQFSSGNLRACASTNESPDDSQLIQDMLHRIRSINQIPDTVRNEVLDFSLDGVKLGKVVPKIAEKLVAVKGESGRKIFEIKENERGKNEKSCFLTLTQDAGLTPAARTSAVAEVMNQLREEGSIKGWRDELYPVADTFYNDPLFLMERAAVSLLGVLEYGVHLNGIVKEHPEKEPKMWIARRSATKSKFPGMLDHIVAGGQPAGLSLMENVIKECKEEAGVPEELARAGLQATGAISYEGWDPKSSKISRVVLFNYDLYLPSHFEPKPVDGEVEEFFLWSIDRVKEAMILDFPDPIKPNCYVVIIDYLLRMGYISPETPGYLDLLRELRSGDCQ